MMDKQTQRQINREREARDGSILEQLKKKKRVGYRKQHALLLLFVLLSSSPLPNNMFFLFQRYVSRRSFMKSDISLPINLAIILSYFSFLVHHLILSSSSLFRSPIFFYLRFLFLYLNIFLSKKLQLHTANISFPSRIHSQTINNSN